MTTRKWAAFSPLYLAALVLLAVDFWMVGLTVESPSFALMCFSLASLGIVANFLQTHTAWGKGIGWLLWLGGQGTLLSLLVTQLPLAFLGNAPADIAWLAVISIVTVLVAFWVGRNWGQFYAGLSFLVVPTLSLFGLIIPLFVTTESVLGIVMAMVIGLFLVSAESLLIRWQRGHLGTITAPMFLRYCWRLAVTASALVLTIGLLLVPPATLLQEPLSRQLMRLPRLRFANLVGGGVEFPDVFTMPGGPINLPDTLLYEVQGTTYPRWRVRSYTHYLGSGWRVSPLDTEPQLPLSVRPTDRPGVVELVWETNPSPRLPTQTAIVTAPLGFLNELPAPGVVQRLRIRQTSPFLVPRTPSGCLLPARQLETYRYRVSARPLPELPPPPDTDPPLTPIERRLLTAFPHYLHPVRLLAQQITQGLDTPYAKAKALEAFLQTHYRYSISPPPAWREPRDVVAFFLFEAREGACDWFASALTLMCRAVGIPARVITGFYSDEVTPEGTLLIRASHAHAWVEAYIDGHGWVTLDATPSGAITRRQNLLQRMQQWLSRSYRLSLVSPNFIWWLVVALWMMAAFPLAVQAGRLAWETYRPKPRWRRLVDAYLSAVRYARRLGMPLDIRNTPWENAHRCDTIPRFPLAGKSAFRRLADLVVMTLYAGVEPSDEDCQAARQALQTFRQQARNYARWFVRSQWSWQSVKEWLTRW